MKTDDAIFLSWISGAAFGIGLPISAGMGAPYLLMFVAVALLAVFLVDKAARG